MPVEAKHPIPGARTAKAKRNPLLKESHVQQTCVQFLELDGWRAFRTELTVQLERGRVVGERGQPDYLFVRYRPSPYEIHVGQKGVGDDPWLPVIPCQAEVLWIEFKRPGEKPRPGQLAWHEAERKRGALVLVVDDIDDFIAWYRSSGLARRREVILEAV